MENVADIQDVLEQIMDALAGSFGDSCEIVLHDHICRGRGYRREQHS